MCVSYKLYVRSIQNLQEVLPPNTVLQVHESDFLGYQVEVMEH